MRTRSKLLLAALAATLVMAAGVGLASARTLSISEQRYRAVWTPMNFADVNGLIQLRCNVTLRGSFHTRTSAKVRGALTGYITEASVARPCTGGEVWILNGRDRPTNTLPWHITFDSFRGTLPLITGTRSAVIGSSYLISTVGFTCLYAGTTASPAFGIVNIERTGVATNVRIDETSPIPLRESVSGICPASGAFSGTTSSLLGDSGATITVRLI